MNGWAASPASSATGIKIELGGLDMHLVFMETEGTMAVPRES